MKNWVTKDWPFRPGAGYSGDGFGLRNQDGIGSAFHPGVDRSGRPNHILMPFDGTFAWKLDKGAFGSLLRLIPDSIPDLEIHIAHSERCDKHRAPLSGKLTQAQPLPFYASDLGLSVGAHTHTECVLQFSRSNYCYLSTQDNNVIYDNGQVKNEPYIKDHCKKYGLDYERVIERLHAQARAWGIEEIRESFCLRRGLPVYRRPHWGPGMVILFDSRRYLDL